MTHANSLIERNPHKQRAGVKEGTTPSCNLQENFSADIAYNKPGKCRAVDDA